jgi:hypothetical protein
VASVNAMTSRPATSPIRFSNVQKTLYIVTERI